DRRLRILAASLQSPQTPHRHRRRRPLSPRSQPAGEVQLGQKSQSSSSVATALPITYDEPDPEKKSWFSSAFGESADRIAGFTSVTVAGNIASYPRFISALLAL